MTSCNDYQSTLELTVNDFAELFGISVDTMPEECMAMIDRHDFRYRILQGRERDQTLIKVLETVDSGELSLAGEHAKPRWEKGWGENLKEFEEHGMDISKLVPKYIRPDQPLRLNQQYVQPIDPDFELNWYNVFRHWLFRSQMAEFDAIYEFGCGSGFNLAELARMYPDKHYMGFDWAESSTRIVDKLGSEYGWNMSGALFDFFSPTESVQFDENSLVLTIGALEQTSGRYLDFLNFLLKRSPALCIHVEPIVEWYEDDNLEDYAAAKFHKFRRYWEGFPGRLAELENEGKVEIIKQKRSFFGSLFIEGYSQIIWRPIS